MDWLLCLAAPGNDIRARKLFPDTNAPSTTHVPHVNSRTTSVILMRGRGGGEAQVDHCVSLQMRQQEWQGNHLRALPARATVLTRMRGGSMLLHPRNWLTCPRPATAPR